METNHDLNAWTPEVGSASDPRAVEETALHGEAAVASPDRPLTAASDVLEALARGEIGVDEAMSRLDELDI